MTCNGSFDPDHDHITYAWEPETPVWAMKDGKGGVTPSCGEDVLSFRCEFLHV